jgi:uracil phosphoribosyltransferase
MKKSKYKLIFFSFISIFLNFNLSQANSEILNNHPYFDQKLYELRKEDTKSEKFREILISLSEQLAIEALNSTKSLKNLEKKEVTVTTSTQGLAKHKILKENPVLITILRAGLPVLLGVQKVFPDSEVGFIGVSREENPLLANAIPSKNLSSSFPNIKIDPSNVKTEYIAFPELTNKTVILTETMLATGGSIIEVLKIIEKAKPKNIILICVIASKQGIENIKKFNPSIDILSAAIDPELDSNKFIKPGLGDAGDRAYGKKATIFFD